MRSDSRRLRVTTRGGNGAWRVDAPPRGPLTVEGAAAPVAVTRLDRTTYQAVVDGRRIPVHVVDDGGGCRLFADGCAFTFDIDVDADHADAAEADVDAAAARPPGGEPREPGPALAAPMPATVVATPAERGQTVRAGDVLVVLEAMKMELTIRAPRDGVVDALHCRRGDLVQPGVPLVTMRPPRGA